MALIELVGIILYQIAKKKRKKVKFHLHTEQSKTIFVLKWSETISFCFNVWFVPDCHHIQGQLICYLVSKSSCHINLTSNLQNEGVLIDILVININISAIQQSVYWYIKNYSCASYRILMVYSWNLFLYIHIALWCAWIVIDDVL